MVLVMIRKTILNLLSALSLKAFASSIAGSALLLYSTTVMATVLCNVNITSTAPGTAVSGTVSVGVNDVCTGGSFSFNRLYVGTVPPPPTLPCPSPGECVQFPSGSQAVQWNTSVLPNGVYYLNVGVWNSTGLVKEGGTSQGIEVTIANGTAIAPVPQPTPTQTPTPTGTAALTPTPGPMPTLTPGSGGCSVAIESPASGASLAGTATVSLAESCAGFAFNRLYVGTLPTPPTAPCPSPGECVQFASGSTTVQFDTTQLPEGVWYLNVGVWNSTGLLEEGRTTQGVAVTIANDASTNGASTPPSPTVTPTFQPTVVPTSIPSSVPTALPASGSAIRANDFLNSLGVVTHDIQQLESDTAIINGFKYTGLRIGRDDATHNSTGSGSVQDLCNIHAATINAATNPTGVLYHELPIVDVGSAGNTNDANIADTKAMWDQLAGCGAMKEAEGPNEPNNNPFYYEGNQCSQGASFLPCAQYEAALYQMVKADPALTNFPVACLTEPARNPMMRECSSCSLLQVQRLQQVLSSATSPMPITMSKAAAVPAQLSSTIRRARLRPFSLVPGTHTVSTGDPPGAKVFLAPRHFRLIVPKRRARLDGIFTPTEPT